MLSRQGVPRARLIPREDRMETRGLERGIVALTLVVPLAGSSHRLPSLGNDF